MKMATKALIITSLVMSSIAFAGSETVIAVKDAKKVAGVTALKGTPQTCKYTAVLQNTSDSKGQEVAVYLNSDEDSDTNGALRLRPQDVPLHDGVILSKPGIEISYNNGVLSSKEYSVNDGPRNNDYSLITVNVSRDLKTVTAGSVKQVTKGIFKEIVNYQMSCQF